MKARVSIFYKEGIFDPQGNTVAHSLKELGFTKVQDVRIGKVVEVQGEGHSPDQFKSDVVRMCEKLLVNTVIESYKVELLDK